MSLGSVSGSGGGFGGGGYYGGVGGGKAPENTGEIDGEGGDNVQTTSARRPVSPGWDTLTSIQDYGTHVVTKSRSEKSGGVALTQFIQKPLQFAFFTVMTPGLLFVGLILGATGYLNKPAFESKTLSMMFGAAESAGVILRRFFEGLYDIVAVSVEYLLQDLPKHLRKFFKPSTLKKLANLRKKLSIRNAISALMALFALLKRIFSFVLRSIKWVGDKIYRAARWLDTKILGDVKAFFSWR